jgi:hypothetical protein
VLGSDRYDAAVGSSPAGRIARLLPIGLPLPDMTMDQFMDIEDSWSTREEMV